MKRQHHLFADNDSDTLPERCRLFRRTRRGVSGGTNCGGYESSWSAFARSLPFMEQGNFYNAINFDFTYSGPPNTTLTATPLAFLYCPSDPGSHIDDGSLGGTGDATTSYGTCDGDWYVWSVNWGTPPYTAGPQNRSLFGPNYARRIASITDGTSNTLAASEGFIGHAQMRSCGNTPGPPFGSCHRHLFVHEHTSTWSQFSGGADLSNQQLRHGDRQSKSRRPDRPHPLGQWRRVLLGIHDRQHAEFQCLNRQPGHRLHQRRQDRAHGLGLGR